MEKQHGASAPLNNGYLTVKQPLKDEKPLDKEEEFEKLWLKYPNKDGKKAALRYFKASVNTKEDLADIEKGLKNYLDSPQVKRGYIKNGSTWFNNWRDWVDYKGGIDVRRSQTKDGKPISEAEQRWQPSKPEAV